MTLSKCLMLLMDDCEIYQRASNGKLELNICELAGNLAYHAMMLEANLTPKAGLVDRVSNGSHTDMDINTFIASSDALRPYMKTFVRTGVEAQQIEAKDLLPRLRKVGIEAENAMFKATNGINTHKGMIFTTGLICGAVGWLYGRNQSFDAEGVRRVITQCCASLVTEDLQLSNKIPVTAGERIFHRHGLTGIRGEAAQGYPTIFHHALPVYESATKQGQSEERALSQTLLVLMANNDDTNLVNRGGMEGLDYVQILARDLLDTPIHSLSDFEKQIIELDFKLIDKNLSPGGSADLLAATWLLAQLNMCCKRGNIKDEIRNIGNYE